MREVYQCVWAIKRYVDFALEMFFRQNAKLRSADFFVAMSSSLFD
ncbi:hypothetical protein [Staphylococcus hominis]|nr:hypothetical protein [Staphylococcus hominis]MDS3865503.1 hypothetical protein [Staphylococcus hominis]